jgi:probable phosphoglycerate mutase
VKRLLLVRHGESEWNAVRRLQGQADIDLSARGRAQAEALHPVIAALKPDLVLASDLKRARDTAALLGHGDAEPSETLREIDVGGWTGRVIADIRAKDDAAYRGWRAGTFTPPDGESWAVFRARTVAAVRDGLDRAEARLLVVSHGGVIRALLEGLLLLSPERIVPVGPGSLTVLRQDERTDMRLELFNYTPGAPSFDAPD